MLHLEERLRMGDEIMKTYIYEGGFGIVAKSGVGSAIKHQKNMLKQADIEEAKSWATPESTSAQYGKWATS